MAQVSSSTVQETREEVYAVLLCVASVHCLVEEWEDSEELKPKPTNQWKQKEHRMKWCVGASKYRCDANQWQQTCANARSM